MFTELVYVTWITSAWLGWECREESENVLEFHSAWRMVAVFVSLLVCHLMWWWSGIAVARWSLSTKLTYIGPG